MARRVSGRSSSGFAPLWRASLLSLTVVATVLCLSIAMATPAAAGRPGPHGLGKPWHGLGLGLCSRALHSYSNSYSNRNSYRNSDSDRNSDSCSSRGVVARSSRQRSSQTDAEEVHVVAAGGGATASASEPLSLSYFQTMTAGALSRTMAQTLMHPAITYKTVLQLRHRVGPGQAQPALTFERLLRGVDAQFLLSLPHGAFHFFVIDRVKAQLTRWLPQRLDAMADFSASAISTVICSVVSTPQMVLTDRLMAGVYPSFPHALRAIMAAEGWKGFYTGWWPALAQKIPSYG